MSSCCARAPRRRWIWQRSRRRSKRPSSPIWSGLTENDGFNRLVLDLGVSWREAALIRTLARYRQQTGLDPSQGVQEEALADNPAITRLILDLFTAKFDPAAGAELKARQDKAEALFVQIGEALQAVASLDADRVLRRLALLVRATVRTNYYQPDAEGLPKPYISFKVASRDLADLPAAQALSRDLHLVAPGGGGASEGSGRWRGGGLRWSDRRDDFRTEVLGLAKAQQVKNAVIVPVGAKGGFYPKRPAARRYPGRHPRGGRFGLQNLPVRPARPSPTTSTPRAQVVPPENVIRHDGDDPYLVGRGR